METEQQLYDCLHVRRRLPQVVPLAWCRPFEALGNQAHVRLRGQDCWDPFSQQAVIVNGSLAEAGTCGGVPRELSKLVVEKNLNQCPKCGVMKDLASPHA
jgi:hypothetical protein